MPDSPQDIFLGRQPILDRRQRIVAYELLFRASLSPDANVLDDLQASASVITQAFSELGLVSVLGNKKGYINVSADLLLSSMIELLPRDKVVIELLETIQIDEQIVSRCRELKAKGFSLALDDFNGDTRFEPLLEIADVVKVDLPQLAERDALEKSVKYLKRWPAQLLAEKIERVEQANHCRELGFDLFQGYYYARPSILTGKRTDTSKLALMRLLGLALGDAETEEIEHVFKCDLSLSYNLLRLVNSVAMGMRHEICSLRQAIVVLGRQQLQRWIQLLLFVNPGDDLHSPLLELAATRGKLMELLVAAQPGQDGDDQDRAFMVGIMSLLDTLLGIPLKEVVKQVSLTSEVENALLNHDGPLGKLLLLVKKMEWNDFGAVAEIRAGTRLRQKDLTLAQLEAMRWANAIKESVAF